MAENPKLDMSDVAETYPLVNLMNEQANNLLIALKDVAGSANDMVVGAANDLTRKLKSAAIKGLAKVDKAGGKLEAKTGVPRPPVIAARLGDTPQPTGPIPFTTVVGVPGSSGSGSGSTYIRCPEGVDCGSGSGSDGGGGGEGSGGSGGHCQQYLILYYRDANNQPTGQCDIRVVGLNPAIPPGSFVAYQGCDPDKANAAAQVVCSGNSPQVPPLTNPCCGIGGGGGGGGTDPCNPTLYFYDTDPSTGCPATTWDTCSCPPPQCQIKSNTFGPFSTAAERDAAAAAATAACSGGGTGGGGGGGTGGGGGGSGSGGGGGQTCPPPVVNCPAPVVQCPPPVINVAAPVVNVLPPAISISCGGNAVDVAVSQQQYQEQTQAQQQTQTVLVREPPPPPSDGTDPLERPVWIDSPAAFFWGHNAQMFRDQLWKFMGLQETTSIATWDDMDALVSRVSHLMSEGGTEQPEEREYIA